MDGKEEVIICTDSGEVRGYLPADAELIAMTEDGVQKANTKDQKEIAKLHAEKQVLMAELRLLERNAQSLKKGGDRGDGSTNATPQSSLSPSTSLSYKLEASEEDGFVALRVEASTEVQISNLIAIDQDGAVLDGSEVLVVSPAPSNKSAILPLRPTKNQQGTLRIQTHISSRGNYGTHSVGSSHLQVVEKTLDVPKFSVFSMLAESCSCLEPSSSVTLRINESLQRVADWIKESFLVSSTGVNFTSDGLRVRFRAVFRREP